MIVAIVVVVVVMVISMTNFNCDDNDIDVGREVTGRFGRRYDSPLNDPPGRVP